MRYVTKELIGLFGMLIFAFLLFTHATGFATATKATASGLSTVARTLQGR